MKANKISPNRISERFQRFHIPNTLVSKSQCMNPSRSYTSAKSCGFHRIKISDDDKRRVASRIASGILCTRGFLVTVCSPPPLLSSYPSFGHKRGRVHTIVTCLRQRGIRRVYARCVVDAKPTPTAVVTFLLSVAF